MGLLRRIFSSEYRKALAAEAGGDYLSAARSYGMCGEVSKVIQMHLAQARLESTLEARITQLRAALEAATAGKDPQRRELLGQLADKLSQQAAQLDPSTVQGQQSLGEAASLFEEAGLWQRAGDCHLQLEDRNQAAAAYAKAGLPDRVEDLLTQEEEQRRKRRTTEDRFKDYQMHLEAGQRDEAARALRDCAETATQPGEYRRLLDDLEKRLLSSGRVCLDLDGKRITLAGRFPVWLGRDADCELRVRGSSVSRRHAGITWNAERQEFWVSDGGSYNGTLLNGLKLAAEMPLPTSGTLQLGSGCILEFKLLGEPADCFWLTVGLSLDQGMQLLASQKPMELNHTLEGGPPLIISFDDGRPLARATGGNLLLNGNRVNGGVQLIVDDQLRLDDHRIRVIG